MADTSIEWTDKVWNPVTGCTKVSQGCKHCYAERVFPRAYGRDREPPTADLARPREFTDVRFYPERLDQPLHWKKPARIFVNSMSDLFHEAVPDDFIDSVFAVMGACEDRPTREHHIFQVLTKRPERMKQYMLTRGHRAWNLRRISTEAYPPRNVHLGVSVEDQETADERIQLLLQTPASVRFISAEPLLSRINLDRWTDRCPKSERVDWPLHGWVFDGDDPYVVCHWCGERRDAPSGKLIGPRLTVKSQIDWVIAGGESGPVARPAHPDWFRSLRDQCVAAGVPFFFKQWGEWRPFEASDRGIQTAGVKIDGERASALCAINPEIAAMAKLGKKAAGALLDGREWKEFPKG